MSRHHATPFGTLLSVLLTLLVVLAAQLGRRTSMTGGAPTATETARQRRGSSAGSPSAATRRRRTRSARMYEKGEGVAQDQPEGTRWFEMADAAQLQKSMSAEQVDEAMKRVYAWQAKPEQ